MIDSVSQLANSIVMVIGVQYMELSWLLSSSRTSDTMNSDSEQDKQTQSTVQRKRAGICVRYCGYRKYVLGPNCKIGSQLTL